MFKISENNRVSVASDEPLQMADSTNIGKNAIAGSHKQARGVRTRLDLIAAARAIFARDGFEHARLEDIASAAGRTRGAFYANFKDKEDVFYAIFEEDTDRDLAQLKPLLSGISKKKERLQALCEFLSELSQDRQRTLLSIEFKLYAIRHPRKRKRLADLHGLMRLQCSIPELHQLLTRHPKTDENDHLSGSLAIGGILDGLALNNLFDPDLSDRGKLIRYLKLCVREALGP